MLVPCPFDSFAEEGVDYFGKFGLVETLPMTLCRCDDEGGVWGEPRLVMPVITPCGE